MDYILVSIAVWPEGHAYVSTCLELGTASEGDTEAEALKNIEEATTLYLNALEEQGECRQTLKEKGITLHTLSPTAGPTIEKSRRPPKPRSAVHPALFPLACTA